MQTGQNPKPSGKRAQKQTTAAANLEALLGTGILSKGNMSAAGTDTLPESKMEVKDIPQELPQQTLSESQEKRIYYMALDFLLDNPYQPREDIAVDDDLREMAEGIKAHGLLGALPVRKHPERGGYYQLAFGHRRREACRLAGKTTAPVTLEELSNATMAALAAIENIHRKDLTHLQLGRLFLNMQREGFTQEEIAENVKKDRGYVVNRLRLAEAPEDIQHFVEGKPDSLRSVAYLVKVKEPEDRALLIERLKAGTLRTDDLAGDISELLDLLKAGPSLPPPVSIGGLTQDNSPAESREVIAAPYEEPTSERATEPTAAAALSPRVGDAISQHAEATEGWTAAPGGYDGQELEWVQARTWSTKLRAILRTLEAYENGLRERKRISHAENELLHKIRVRYSEICSKESVKESIGENPVLPEP